MIPLVLAAPFTVFAPREEPLADFFGMSTDRDFHKLFWRQVLRPPARAGNPGPRAPFLPGRLQEWRARGKPAPR
ncbi:hypothetical protein ACFOM8_16315 [Paracoccus angustae]|uniref:Uncharacterized protein n=1 Tax=Paracoccus angustae TaxID=1671480 RepID=A0ABV7U7Z1_9RHOB